MKPEYKDVINYRDGLNGDIIKVLENNFEKAKKQTENFCLQFEAGNMLDTCRNVWYYVKNNIPYKADGQTEQKIVLPARLVERAEKNGTGADCKSFALFCAANISNIYPDADVNFRYTSYRGSTTPSHVYCIVKTNRGVIIVDPVWHYFNEQKEYKHKIDHSMRIATLSGTGDKVKVDALTYETLKSLKAAADSYPYGSPEWQLFTRQFKVVADAAGLDDPSIGKFKLFQGIKSAFNSVKTVINKGIDKAKNAVKDLKNDILVKPEWASKEDYIKHIAKKAIPMMVEMRVAFLLAITINYRDLCNRLLKANADDPHSMERIWYKGFGGDPKALMAALNQHKNQKPFFGKPKGLKGVANYDGITIGEAETETPPPTGPNATTVAGAAGSVASSIAIAAGLSGPQAAGVAAAITMAFTIIGTFLKNIPKHPSDDDTGGNDTDKLPPGSDTPPPGPPGTQVPDMPPGTTYGNNGEIVPPGGAAAGLFTTKNILIGGAALAALFIVPKLIKK